MKKMIFFLQVFFLAIGCSGDAVSDFYGQWKYEKALKVSNTLSKMEDVEKIFGNQTIKISEDSFFMGEELKHPSYKIIKVSTKDRDPRFNHFTDSYQFGFGKDRKRIIFFDVFSGGEDSTEFEWFENSLIYYWDGYLIYFKKES